MRADAWAKASACTHGNCVEARALATGVQVRDSKDPAGPVLTFTREEWVAFLQGVAAGEFTLDALGPQQAR